MSHLLSTTIRTMALWFAMVFGTILSGILIHSIAHPGKPDGPLSVFAALLLVNAFGAVVVAGLATRLAAAGLRKAAILFVIVFMLETGLSSIESIAFRQTLGLTPSALAAIAGSGLIRAAVTATSATLLWPRGGQLAATFSPGFIRPTAAILLYVALYFAAGMFAWRSEAVRDYYQAGLNIDVPMLLVLQIFRGMLWTALAALLAAKIRGTPMTTALWTAAAFAALMAAPLIYPSAIMPWAVRKVHLVELALSNGAFGLLATLLLRYGANHGSSGEESGCSSDM